MVPADLPVRIAARLIDVAVVVCLDVAIGLVMGFGLDWLVVGSLMVLAYFAVLDAVAGATIGKLVLGLRVVGPAGAKPTPKQALIREAFTLVGAVPLVGPLLALGAWIWLSLSIRTHPQRQGKHDLWAGGTRVVRVRPAMP